MQVLWSLACNCEALNSFSLFLLYQPTESKGINSIEIQMVTITAYLMVLGCKRELEFGNFGLSSNGPVQHACTAKSKRDDILAKQECVY